MIKNVKFIKSCTDKSTYINDDIPEIVILGKSNVGKSTFINTISSNQSLAKTSQTPGKTRLLNMFSVDNKYRLVDAPGYGYAKVNKDNDKSFENIMLEYFKERKNLKGAIFLLDSRRDISDDDLSMLQILLDFNIPFILVSTKVDKLNQSEKAHLDKKINFGLGLPNDTKIIHSSIKDLRFIDEVEKRIEYILK